MRYVLDWNGKKAYIRQEGVHTARSCRGLDGTRDDRGGGPSLGDLPRGQDRELLRGGGEAVIACEVCGVEYELAIEASECAIYDAMEEVK